MINGQCHKYKEYERAPMKLGNAVDRYFVGAVIFEVEPKKIRSAVPG
jgi:hypothetical protein